MGRGPGTSADMVRLFLFGAAFSMSSSLLPVMNSPRSSGIVTNVDRAVEFVSGTGISSVSLVLQPANGPAALAVAALSVTTPSASSGAHTLFRFA